MDLLLAEGVISVASRPVILNGGASSLTDLVDAVEIGVDAVAAGALFVFSGPHKAVMINYPSQEQLREVFNERP
jgi:imidazole glycerol-phosphate synthase subunit HisF